MINLVKRMVTRLLGESTVELEVTRFDEDGSTLKFDVEVELEIIPGHRGARDRLSGIRGAGPPLEPDEPATAEIVRTTVIDPEMAAKFPELELSDAEADQAIELGLGQL